MPAYQFNARALRLEASRRTKNRKVSFGATAGCALLMVLPSATFAAQQVTHSVSVHRAADMSTETNNDVTLDFVQADINDVLKALAVQTGSNIVSSPDVHGTITVSLSHVTLEQALDMITRLSGYSYTKVNNAWLIGSQSDVAAFGSIGQGATPTITEVVTLHYSTADDVANLLKLRYPNVTVSAGTQIAGAQVGSTSSAVLLNGPQDQVELAKDLIASLEDSLGKRVASQTTETYTVHYASLGDLISVLNSLVPSLLVVTGPSNGFGAKAPTASAMASSTSSAGSSGSGASSGASGGSQAAMTGPTMLLLTGTQDDIARGLAILAKVDIKPAQLLYETKVTEIDDSDDKDLGLNWDFTSATTNIGEQNNGTSLLGNNGEPGHILKFGTFSRTAVSDLATVTLQALENEGKARTLADPNIAAVDGYPAQVFIGDTINYVSSITQATTGENVTTASVQVGVIMRVTGKVDPDGYITLNIHPEVSSINGYLSVPGGGSLPNVATRYADTTVRVKDGETIAIGGLIQQSDILSIQKVPFFGDLPFFGNFFKTTDHTKSKDEVVFLLKTSIMQNS
jgi:type II secretory pathway component GspD/PulD (secretin)